MMQIRLKKSLSGHEGPFDLDVDFTLPTGQLLALYGDSGVGKTTLLRCIAGLEQPQVGYITLDQKVWLDTVNRINLPPQQRSTSLMFQDYALFPNMTVRGNLLFAQKKGRDPTRADTLLDMMELGALRDTKPSKLSGGQRQRVALARTLIAEPQLLLLDEPFSALDTRLRGRLVEEIGRLQQQSGMTTLMVSHQVGEIYQLAQQVIVLEQGSIRQQGKPAEVFSQGQTSGKFRFSGQILAMEAMDVMVALTVLVGQQIVRVACMPEEAQTLAVGDTVMLVSKAFNPMVIKLA